MAAKHKQQVILVNFHSWYYGASCLHSFVGLSRGKFPSTNNTTQLAHEEKCSRYQHSAIQGGGHTQEGVLNTYYRETLS